MGKSGFPLFIHRRRQNLVTDFLLPFILATPAVWTCLGNVYVDLHRPLGLREGKQHPFLDEVLHDLVSLEVSLNLL